jgi:hypothetical protein
MTSGNWWTCCAGRLPMSVAEVGHGGEGALGVNLEVRPATRDFEGAFIFSTPDTVSATLRSRWLVMLNSASKSSLSLGIGPNCQRSNA